jgi:hypothetical protein
MTMALAAGMSQETRAMSLARGSGDVDSVDAIIARHPELSHLFKGGRTSSRKHPRRSDRTVTTRTRAHSSDLPDESASTSTDVRGEIDRYLRMRESEWGGESRKATGLGNRVTRPKSAAQREREEHAARDSHGLSIPELHPSNRERGEFRA